MNDRAFLQGACSLLSDYVGLTAGRRAVLVHDPAVEPVARALGAVAAGLGIDTRRVAAARAWPDIRARLADRCDAAVFLEAGRSHHTHALLRYLSAGGPRPRTYRLFGATAETIRGGFRRPRAALRRRNWDLIARARRAGRLTVTSDRGSRLAVGLDPAAAWTNTYGEAADGFPGVLPPAEVNTRSADVDGVLVVDGAIGSNIGWPLDARLGPSPVTLRIAGGLVIDVECRHPLVRELVETFLSVRGCREVVEVGIGTNDGIPRFVPSDVLLNERVAGFHVGVGSADAADRRRNLHLDFIVRDCRVALGGHVVLRHGRFAPARSGATHGPARHPVPVRLHDAL
jgi:leucyl aminopeptidase (aminopeptidase T)